jgi:membrane protease YdiL (CAAX protease family)
LRMKPRDIGLVKKGLGMYIPLGIILGMAVGLLEWFVLRPKPIVSAFTVQAILPAALILFFTTGLVEELIFRGVLQKTSEVFLGWRGLVYVSVSFAILHIGQLSVLEVFFVFAIAMCFAWIVKWSGSLIVVIIAHGITNIILYLIAGFLLT